MHRLAGLLLLLALLGARAEAATVRGTVASGGAGLGGYAVTLYGAAGGPRVSARALGEDVSDATGRFAIRYEPPPGRRDAVLYLVARRGPVALAGALVGSPNPFLPGRALPQPREAVLDERTTVAVGFALAQFIERGRVEGNRVGVRNGAAMVGNLVEAKTAAIAPVLRLPPNGQRNSTLATFNTLANLIRACVADERRCDAILALAPGIQGRPAPETLQAIVNIARNPWRNVDAIFRLASLGPGGYAPALDRAPDAWTLALKFLGNGTLNGPGAFAIDADGNAWVSNNYTPGGPEANVCPGRTVFKFTPTGQTFPGSPYRGGGVEGAGFGVNFDPAGRVWVGNFGFQSPVCGEGPRAASNDSVSLFRADGVPLSPRRGFTAGDISWPQGTVSDRRGNIWLANCGNDSVTIYPNGDPRRARNIGKHRLGLDKPFDVAIDGRGRAWVTGNDSDSVAIIDGGHVQRVGGPAFDQPLGIAADRRGNMWVANSALVDVPCPDGGFVGPQFGGTITLIDKSGAVAPGSPFTGGGLTSPWGLAVDGDDQVWVANFSDGEGTAGPTLQRISQFCGTRPETCPRGKRTGDPISPPSGYTSDALTRVTDVAIDPTGNVWATNNWKVVPQLNNPGADAIVIFIGLAAPLRTPLIGPPVPAR